MVYEEYLERIKDNTRPNISFPLLVEEDDEFVESMFYHEIRKLVDSYKPIDIEVVFKNCGLIYSGFKGDDRIENLYSKALKKIRGY